MMEELPQIITNFINAANNYDTQGFLATFSNDAIIKEDSLGKLLVGKNEIQHYFESYFIDYQTQTEILTYTTSENIIDMKVLFTGNFPGGEINGLFKFSLNDEGQISNLEADLE